MAHPSRDELVVLVHGLGRSRRSLRRLEAALRDHGFETQSWDYPRSLALADLVARFRHFLERLNPPGLVHFVGHSLGGILIRGALRRPAPVTVGRIVMIAPPNTGVGLLDRAGLIGLARWAYGRPARDLVDGGRGIAAYGVPDADIGVLAGTRRFHPLNPTAYLSALLGRQGFHDGTIDVEHTKLPGMTDFLTVPASHTWIASDPEVIRQTLHFLEHGGFVRPGPKPDTGANAASSDRLP